MADFVPNTPSAEAATDTYGHGSLMAQLLMEVAPLAEVYIARVAENTESLSESKEAITRALQWADQQDVDIISMSFGLAEYDSCVARSIGSVHSRRGDSVIFIASAGNSLYEAEKFPACHPFVIAIHATNSLRTFAKTNPALRTDSGLVFGTYGDQLPSRFTEDYGTICQPGSSVAAAIAAGIAAIMLSYIEALPLVGLGALDEGKMEQELERRRERLLSLQKLRTKDGMSSLFNRMAPHKTHPRQRWICPVWFWYDRPLDAERETALLEVASDVRIAVPAQKVLV